MSQDGGKGNTEKMQQSAGAYFPTKVHRYYVNFEGNLGQNYVTPRGLQANIANQYVAV